MGIPLLLLAMALVILLWQDATDKAMRALRERLGQPHDPRGQRIAQAGTWTVIGLILFFLLAPASWYTPAPPPPAPLPQVATWTEDSLWTGADTARLTFLDDADSSLIRYGRELIVNTAAFLGTQGSVAALTNGMNCQNCHLDAGTKPWGNNYGAVWSTYPKFRARSGGLESLEKRVNDCMERSLNGTALDSSSREMRAIVAYMQWLGTGIRKEQKPKGSGIVELAYMDRAADPAKGAEVFKTKCASCHGNDGQGILKADGITYQYPPLWGPHSYNQGAGLFRLSRFAGYVKANMPQGASWERPQLTDEEAWDVAAYVNAQPRPTKDLSTDWPDIAKKPVDHPFGPYKDPYSEQQHKFGPFGPIAAFYRLSETKSRSAGKP